MSCAFCLTSEALEQVLPTCWETLTLNWYFSPFFVIINALAVCTFFNFTYLLNLAYLSLRLIPSQISISAHCIPPLQGKRGIQHVSSVPFILISNSAFRHALGDIKIAYFVLPFGESFVMRIINYQEITHIRGRLLITVHFKRRSEVILKMWHSVTEGIGGFAHCDVTYKIRKQLDKHSLQTV